GLVSIARHDLLATSNRECVMKKKTIGILASSVAISALCVMTDVPAFAGRGGGGGGGGGFGGGGGHGVGGGGGVAGHGVGRSGWVSRVRRPWIGWRWWFSWVCCSWWHGS